ncbi:hypothetical protein BGZ83_000291 [Gryganskiella cystojenkinii]|nr:hypothetical protein BGZ83_000291 [Gryganskiella cystojenkinii]
MTTNLLLVGNAGIGKSYLLNSLGGNFMSGFNAVDGLTTNTSYNDVEIGGSTVRLIDVPGLLEASDEYVVRNSKEITEALRVEGRFKIIIVLAERSGRVDPSDLFLVGKVMSAIDFSVNVGVIINRVPEADMELYLDATTQSDITQKLNSVANGKIKESWFAVIPRFHRDNLTGAAPFLEKLLANMTSQRIVHVTPIVASVKEYNLFVKFLMKVKKFFVGLWNEFQESLQGIGRAILYPFLLMKEL